MTLSDKLGDEEEEEEDINNRVDRPEG